MKIIHPTRDLKSLLLVSVLLFFFIGPALDAAPPNCGEAEILYKQASASQEFEERVTLFGQSIAICNTFEANYKLARTYQAASDFDQALTHYKQAKAVSREHGSLGLATARISQIAREQSKLCEAYTASESAQESFSAAGKKKPAWFEREIKAAGLARKESGASADLIECMVASSRAFKVVPSIDLAINFEYNSAELLDTGSQQVDQLVKFIERVDPQGTQVQLFGHTDSRGGDDFNLTLSQLRAEVVSNYLQEKLPSLKDKILTKGMGETDLLFSDNDESSHSLNRRVEVKFKKLD